MIEYKSFTDFPRGTMYAILKDAYSYDNRNKEGLEIDYKVALHYKKCEKHVKNKKRY